MSMTIITTLAPLHSLLILLAILYLILRRKSQMASIIIIVLLSLVDAYIAYLSMGLIGTIVKVYPFLLMILIALAGVDQYLFHRKIEREQGPEEWLA